MTMRRFAGIKGTTIDPIFNINTDSTLAEEFRQEVNPLTVMAENQETV
jgi:hypothetical protein